MAALWKVFLLLECCLSEPTAMWSFCGRWFLRETQNLPCGSVLCNDVSNFSCSFCIFMLFGVLIDEYRPDCLAISCQGSYFVTKKFFQGCSFWL